MIILNEMCGFRCKWKERLLAEDFLYFLSFGLFLVTSILSTSFYYSWFMGKPYMWLQILCVAMLAGYELRRGGFRAQQWVGFGISVALFLIAFWVSAGNLHRIVALMFLYIYCGRRIHFARIAGFTLNLSIVTVLVVVLSGYLGIIDNVVTAKGSRVREFLGFRYALYLPGILLNMTALWIYLRKDKVSISGSLVWALANWFVFYKTDSRISFVLGELLLVAALLMRFLPKVVEKLHSLFGVLAWSFVIFGGFSLIMTAVYDDTIPWMRELNGMLESRLSLGKRSLVENGFTLLGQKIEWVGNGLDAFGNSSQKIYTYVDCLYVKILQRYGLIFTLAMVVLMTWAMIRLWKRREYHIVLILASVAAHCVLDDLSFALHYNTFWLAMGTVLLNPGALPWEGYGPRLAPKVKNE